MYVIYLRHLRDLRDFLDLRLPPVWRLPLWDLRRLLRRRRPPTLEPSKLRPDPPVFGNRLNPDIFLINI